MVSFGYNRKIAESTQWLFLFLFPPPPSPSKKKEKENPHFCGEIMDEPPEIIMCARYGEFDELKEQVEAGEVFFPILFPIISWPLKNPIFSPFLGYSNL